MQLENSSLITTIEQSSKLILRPVVQIVPILQKKTYSQLLLALASTNQVLTLNSAFRLIPQQTVLYHWYLKGLCGITLAAEPGNSSHESGLAIDIRDYKDWIKILSDYGFVWKGETDVVHFTYEGDDAESINNLNVLAFQKLWNCNNPNDAILEDGIYEAETEKRILKSPIDGFEKTCLHS